MANINFHILESNFKLKQIRKLKDFLQQIFILEKHELESMDYIFCNDEYLLTLNQNYLNHDTLTDILTFPLSEPNAPLIAEIYISTDRVKENAQLFHTSFELELHRVMIHGVLHLCGYDDHSDKDKKAMRRKEDEYLMMFHVKH